MESFVGKVCPYCQSPIKPGAQAMVCNACGIPHHDECWRENGRCTTFGCNGAPAEAGAAPQLAPPPVLPAGISAKVVAGYADPLADLRRAAAYFNARHVMRSTYIASFVWAAINIVFGCINVANGNPVAIGPVIFGFLMLAEGIWLATAMAPAALILDGVIFLVIAIWNILMGLVTIQAGGFMLIGLGGFQIYWGIMSLLRHSQFSSIMANKPAPQVLYEMETRLKLLRQSNATVPQVIQFTSQNATKYLQ